MDSTMNEDKPKTPSLPCLTKRESKPRRMRKQPLMALGDRRIGTDLSRSDTSQRLLEASSLSLEAKRELYDRLQEDLQEFMLSAAKNWQDTEECRRFTIFGDCITCAKWNDQSFVSGADIVKAVSAMYRLSNMGETPVDRKKFEESIISDLRGLKSGSHAILEEANSKFLQFLYRINSVRTHKRQKIFFWETVPFIKLFRDATERENRMRRPVEQKRGRSNSYPFINSSQALVRGPATNIKRSCEGTESASPRSWSSPESNTERSGFVLYMPPAMRRNSAPDQAEIAKLSIVADAALGFHDEEYDSSDKESLALPPIKDQLEMHASSLPNLDSILPK